MTRKPARNILMIGLLLLSSLSIIGSTTSPASASETDAIWTDVDAGDRRKPTITIPQLAYPTTAASNRFQTGVQFLINGDVDDRHRNRPNGWDATGPNEGSTFHIHPAITLRDGDIITARWLDPSGKSHTSTHVVGPSEVSDSTDGGSGSAVWSNGIEVDAADVTWSRIDPGNRRRPAIAIDNSLYPDTALTNVSGRGVQFLLNGAVDDRHRNRPDGWDATGEREGSTFHMHPAFRLNAGDVIEARWNDESGTSYFSTITVREPASASPDAAPNSTSDRDPATYDPAPSTSDQDPDPSPSTSDQDPDTNDPSPTPPAWNPDLYDDPPAIEDDREPVVIWTNGVEADAALVGWSSVDAGSEREPRIDIGGFVYPQVEVNARPGMGVQFLLNGQIDDRHYNRPEGWDPTGVLEGSSFHMFPALALESGDEIEARWVDTEGQSYYSTVIVGGELAPAVDGPEPADEPDPTADAPSQPVWTDGIEAAEADALWSSISAGSDKAPKISIADAVYPRSGAADQLERGVQFWLNGEIDARSDKRPNGWDATGEQEDSTFHMHPAFTLQPGDVLEARWIDEAGQAYFSTVTVEDGPAPTAPLADDQPPAPTSIDGLGPTGQWPHQYGFPAYDTPATIVTNGTLSGLRDAIEEINGTGGVIEHPGNIRDAGYGGLARSGSAPIVIRPPLGQRAEYFIEDTLYLRGDGILMAGFYHKNGAIYVQDVVNSGAAWIESDHEGRFNMTARFETSRTVRGIWYEAVYRSYVIDTHRDRSRINAIASGARAELDAVGIWLAGHARAVGSAAHVDTMQIVETNGGQAAASIRNSVVWPSSNVSFQGTGVNGFTIIDSWFTKPSYVRQMFPDGDPGPGLDGHGAVTGKANIDGTIMLGRTHPQSTVHISDSQLYNPGSTYIDDGGNVILDSIWDAVPPLAPTHEELDLVWHD